MPRTTRICKICGKEYEYCHTLRRESGVFRYQDVACCPEHGSMYLQKIEESRAAVDKIEEILDDIAKEGLSENDEKVYSYYDFDDDDDDWFDDDDDDDDDDDEYDLSIE